MRNILVSSHHNKKGRTTSTTQDNHNLGANSSTLPNNPPQSLLEFLREWNPNYPPPIAVAVQSQSDSSASFQELPNNNNNNDDHQDVLSFDNQNDTNNENSSNNMSSRVRQQEDQEEAYPMATLVAALKGHVNEIYQGISSPRASSYNNNNNNNNTNNNNNESSQLHRFLGGSFYQQEQQQQEDEEVFFSCRTHVSNDGDTTNTIIFDDFINEDEMQFDVINGQLVQIRSSSMPSHFTMPRPLENTLRCRSDGNTSNKGCIPLGKIQSNVANSKVGRWMRKRNALRKQQAQQAHHQDASTTTSSTTKKSKKPKKKDKKKKKTKVEPSSLVDARCYVLNPSKISDDFMSCPAQQPMKSSSDHDDHLLLQQMKKKALVLDDVVTKSIYPSSYSDEKLRKKIASESASAVVSSDRMTIGPMKYQDAVKETPQDSVSPTLNKALTSTDNTALSQATKPGVKEIDSDSDDDVPQDSSFPTLEINVVHDDHDNKKLNVDHHHHHHHSNDEDTRSVHDEQHDESHLLSTTRQQGEEDHHHNTFDNNEDNLDFNNEEEMRSWVREMVESIESKQPNDAMPMPQPSFLSSFLEIKARVEAKCRNQKVIRPRRPFHFFQGVVEKQHDDDELLARAGPFSTTSSLTSSSSNASFDILSDEEPLLYNDTLKLIFIGDKDTGKTSIINKLTNPHHDGVFENNSTTIANETCPGKPIDLQVYDWNPIPSGVKYSIWDLPGGTEKNGVHEATSSLFFSPNALFILVWDMAVNDPKTYRDVTAEGDENNNILGGGYLARENANKKADRALERDIQEKVIYWMECIRKRAPKNCAIMPVASFEDRLNQVEADRRRKMMKKCILQNNSKDGIEVIFAANNDIPLVSSKIEGGTDRLKQAIMNMTDIAPLMDDHIFGNHLHRRQIPPLTMALQKVLSKLKKDHHVVSVDTVRNILRENFEGKVLSGLRESLIYLASIGDILYPGYFPDSEYILCHYIILNPSWLVSAVECILQPNLKGELLETRNRLNSREFDEEFPEDFSFSFINDHEKNPVIISSQDMTMMWESMEFMMIERNKLFTRSAPCLFTYLQFLMIHCGIIVPFQNTMSKHSTSEFSPCLPSHFFLPSHLPHSPPDDFWSFKSKELWKTTIGHTWQLQKSVPFSLMQDLIITVLKDFTTSHKAYMMNSSTFSERNFPFYVRQVLCWKSAFWIEIVEEAIDMDSLSNNRLASRVEIFVGIFDGDSNRCVASGSTPSSNKKLVLSAKGPAGNQGQKIWKYGYGFVLDCIDRVTSQCQRKIVKQVLCPQCLTATVPRNVCSWNVSSFEYTGEDHMTCRYAHKTSTRLLCGITSSTDVPSEEAYREIVPMNVKKLLGSVVLVGLWDGKSTQIYNIGSGFVADKRSGLIITASHVLFNMEEGKNYGEKFFGLKKGKIVIGCIPQDESSDHGRSTALFQYFAEVVSYNVDKIDACVLRLTTKFLEPVGRNIEGCADQPEKPLLFDAKGDLTESLTHLKLTKRYELDENVRILGYNQGHNGNFAPGTQVNRTACFARGYVCMRPPPFELTESSHEEEKEVSTKQFVPNEEIVVMCPTIEGHSGGPCVNSEGKVIGILSRSDRNNKQRCYLVPSKQLQVLLKDSKQRLSMSPSELFMS